MRWRGGARGIRLAAAWATTATFDHSPLIFIRKYILRRYPAVSGTRWFSRGSATVHPSAFVDTRQAAERAQRKVCSLSMGG